MEPWKIQQIALTLTGTLASLPEYSHQNHERKFFRFLLSVDRLSGTEDLLPVLAAEDVLAQADLFAGERFTIEGQIRSFNNREPVGRRLILCVYALSLTTTQEPMQNEAVLTGTVCKPPVYRQTPLGRQITDLCLAVPRLYRRTDYIPCILWGRTALAAAEYPIGTELTLTGRLQSRTYLKNLGETSETRTAYELPSAPASASPSPRSLEKLPVSCNQLRKNPSIEAEAHKKGELNMKKRSILAILLAALLALTIFTGCAAAPNPPPWTAAPQAPTMEAPMEESVEAEEFAYDTVATSEAGGAAAETPEPDDSVADYTAKIIYTASVSIETTEFDKAVAALESKVQAIGGFVESSNVTGDTQYNSDGTTTVVNRWAYYTVRIPCDHFESFLHETGGLRQRDLHQPRRTERHLGLHRL